MKCEVSEICGDWALDINNFNGGKITIYFNSRQNALNVKRILEVDDSIPNAATVCDMQEVVRCKNCKYAKKSEAVLGIPDTDEEIIKRLERCVKRGNRNYDTDIVLDLINRQKAENEMLKKRISDKKHALFEQQEYMAELQRTLETKCDDCDNIRLSRPEYWKAIKAAKAEAHKEFVERLKGEIKREKESGDELLSEIYDRDVQMNAEGEKMAFDSVERIVDKLLKEMVGEEE